MSSRKIRYKKSDGTIVTEKFSFNKNKKYKFNKSTGAVEEFTGTPAEDEITIPGSKSSLRRLAEVERNISILASKSGVAGQSNSDTDTVLNGIDNGSVDIISNDADFVVRDTTDGTTNFIWRKHSTNQLLLGTPNAKPTLRTAMDANSENITGIATAGMANGYASAKFAVANTSVHASYDFYNNGTTYLNGTTNVDADLNITSGNLNLGSGAIVMGNNGREGLYFESDKHAITWNDGQGNFNIRVGNNGLANENCTEAGYIFHDEWSQSSGWRQFNVSSASLAIGDAPTWVTAIQYDNTGNVSIGGSLTAAGDVTAYSDERLKSDIVTFDNALETVSQLRGVKYIKDGKASTGVIAQEVEAVMPEVVHTADDEMGTKSVAYGNMMGVMIEAIKELKGEVASLKAELAELKK